MSYGLTEYWWVKGKDDPAEGWHCFIARISGGDVDFFRYDESQPRRISIKGADKELDFIEKIEPPFR